MKKLTLLVFYLTLFIKTNFILGQIDLPKDKVNVTFSIDQTDCITYLVANVNIEKGWHINSIIHPSNSNSIPTEFKINTSKGFSIASDVIEPKPKTEYVKEIDETLSYHEGKFSIKRKITIKTERDNIVSGFFSFQTCNEYKCLPVETIEFNLKIKGCQKDNKDNSSKIETEFIKKNDDVATHKDGSTYIFVNKKWHRVPKGNSIEFYRKYLTITEKDE